MYAPWSTWSTCIGRHRFVNCVFVQPKKWSVKKSVIVTITVVQNYSQICMVFITKIMVWWKNSSFEIFCIKCLRNELEQLVLVCLTNPKGIVWKQYDKTTFHCMFLNVNKCMMGFISHNCIYHEQDFATGKFLYNEIWVLVWHFKVDTRDQAYLQSLTFRKYP